VGVDAFKIGVPRTKSSGVHAVLAVRERSAVQGILEAGGPRNSGYGANNSGHLLKARQARRCHHDHNLNVPKIETTKFN